MSDASVPLSNAQQTQILSVFQDGQTAEKASGSSSSDQAARQQQMRALRASIDKAVRALLTEAQAQVFDRMRSFMQHGQGAPQNPAGAAPADGTGPPN